MHLPIQGAACLCHAPQDTSIKLRLNLRMGWIVHEIDDLIAVRILIEEIERPILRAGQAFPRGPKRI